MGTVGSRDRRGDGLRNHQGWLLMARRYYRFWCGPVQSWRQVGDRSERSWTGPSVAGWRDYGRCVWQRLDIGLSRLTSDPVLSAQLVGYFCTVCLNLLFITHPFRSSGTPAKTVDVQANTRLARIANALLVAFLSPETTRPTSASAGRIGTR